MFLADEEPAHWLGFLLFFLYMCITDCCFFFFQAEDGIRVFCLSRGLGREIGEYLALQGAKVVLMGRNEETGKQIVGGIRGKGGEATFLRTDVMNPAVVEQNLQDVLSAYGRVDALLNAAGGNMPGACPLYKSDAADDLRCVDLGCCLII